MFNIERNKGIILNGLKLEVVELGDKYKEEDLLVHDKYNETLAYMLIEYSHPPHFPMVLGILYEKEQSTYEHLMEEQIKTVKAKKGEGNFKELLYSGETWTVKNES